MEYYSSLKDMSYKAMKRQKIIWLLLSERGEPETVQYFMIPTTWHSGKNITLEIKKKWVAVGDGGDMNRQSTGDILV